MELPHPDIPDLQDTFFCGFGYDVFIHDYKLIMGVTFVATEDAKVQRTNRRAWHTRSSSKRALSCKPGNH
ncbi:hypothetical protein Q3G72_013023 [Acer saccharum]|nr:hypothetical protein Q3G72_013023 [Acer saccharum]